MSDHELLECIDKKVAVNTALLKGLRNDFSEHKKHHWAVTISAITAVFVGSSSLIVGLILIIVKG